MLSTNTIQTRTEFQALQPEWDELLARSDDASVFLTHEWLSTWWKHLGKDRSLHVLTVRDNGRLIGVLPLALRVPQYSRMMPRVLEFLGSGVVGSDYLDAIVDREREEETLDAFAHNLARSRFMVQFGQLRRGECKAQKLASRLARSNWRVSDTRVNVCPYIPLNVPTWDDYLATLGNSQRSNFQRRLRNLQKVDGFRFVRAQTVDEAGHALDVLIELHKKRWSATPHLSEAFQSDSIIAFHREFVQLAAKRGWLRLLSLWIKDAPAAALYGLRYGSTFSFYQSGFDTALSRQSVGLVMMGLAIKSAFEEGALEYDLLHGNEEYKFHWTGKTRELGRIELFPPYARGAFYRHCVGLNRAARRMVRRMLIRA